MRGVIFTILVAVFVAGCSSSTHRLNSGIISTSDPIFIDEIPKDRRVFASFDNTSGVDSNLTEAVNFYLQKDGYTLTNEKNANIIIKGNLNYFRRAVIREIDPFSGGFGFFGTGRRGGMGIGVGLPLFEGYDDRNYIYDAQVSLLIRVKDDKNSKDYKSNLNYQSDKNINSTSTMMDIFNYKIYKQIKYYIKDKNASDTNDSRQ